MLKEEGGGDLLVIGSTELVHTLIEADLVDEFRFMIDPLLVGCGNRIFPDDGVLRPLRLVDSHLTTTARSSPPTLLPVADLDIGEGDYWQWLSS